MGKIFDALKKIESDSSIIEPEPDIKPKFESADTDTDPDYDIKPKHADTKLTDEQIDNNDIGKCSDNKKPDISNCKKAVSFAKKRPEQSNFTVDVVKPECDISKIDQNLITLFKPQSFQAEQFKMLRTNLLFPSSGKPPRAIMITSAVPGEGKSFVAANLSICIAQNINEFVLLMDCDIRKPSVHNRFGFGKVPGLSEYLSDGSDFASLLLRTNIEKLSILPAGMPPHNPSELLSSEKMSLLFDEVKKRYNDRYIIVDAPPPLLTSEASALARQVDAVLLVVKYGHTPRALISELIEIVGKEKIFGVILNWFDALSPTYYGKKAYGKYGKYHEGYYKEG